jgi:hypothetical protein
MSFHFERRILLLEVLKKITFENHLFKTLVIGYAGNSRKHIRAS